MNLNKSNRQSDFQYRKKSLRSKLNQTFKSKEKFARNQTKVIILNKDGNLEEAATTEPVKEKINFEIELEHWKSNHLNQLKNDLVFNTYFERTLEVILSFLTKTENKTKTSVDFFKQAMNESGANVLLLDLPRESRKMIFRRLDSLFFKKILFHQILKDPSVKKIVVANSLRIFFEANDGIKVKKHNIFTSRLEAKVFNLINNKIHFENSTTQSEILNLNEQSCLIEKTIEEESEYLTFRSVHQKATTLLDLMRDKTLATAHGPFIIKYLNKGSQGILISGRTASGKTKVLASFLSTIVNSKFIALTGNPDEFRNISKDFQIISRDLLIETYKNEKLEYLADNIAKSGVNYYVSDDSSHLEISFAYILYVKHGIPSLISLTAQSEINTILHYINNAMNLLRYSAEREFFIWNFTRAFPMLFSISNNQKGGEGTLSKLNSNNGIIKLLPISIEKPELTSHTNLS